MLRGFPLRSAWPGDARAGPVSPLGLAPAPHASLLFLCLRSASCLGPAGGPVRAKETYRLPRASMFPSRGMFWKWKVGWLFLQPRQISPRPSFLRGLPDFPDENRSPPRPPALRQRNFPLRVKAAGPSAPRSARGLPTTRVSRRSSPRARVLSVSPSACLFPPRGRDQCPPPARHSADGFRMNEYE